MARDDSVALTADLLAPAHARAWLSDRAAAIPSAVLDDALLIVSELVTNAVRHGRPEIVLSVRPVPAGVQLSVADGGEHEPVPPSGRPSLNRPSGRGLLIVAATAHDWGVVLHDPGPGKTVWAELRV